MIRCKWIHPIMCWRPLFKATWPWLRHGHQLFDGPQLGIPYVHNGAKLFINSHIFNPFLISRDILCNISNYPSKSKNENLQIFYSVVKVLRMWHRKDFGLICRQLIFASSVSASAWSKELPMIYICMNEVNFRAYLLSHIWKRIQWKDNSWKSKWVD